MPAKIKSFAESALVDPVTVNVGRAGATNLDIIQVRGRWCCVDGGSHSKTTSMMAVAALPRPVPLMLPLLALLVVHRCCSATVRRPAAARSPPTAAAAITGRHYMMPFSGCVRFT